jgi:hypothetical protein
MSDGLKSECKECARLRGAEYYFSHREKTLSRQAKYYVANREKLLRQQAEYRAANSDRLASYRAENRARTLFHSARRRAQKTGLPFAISPEDVYIPERCPLSACGHRPLVGGKERMWSASPSLDRYDPPLGYIPGNIWVICMGCNRLKQEMSGKDHITFGEQLEDAFAKYTQDKK